MSKKNKDPSKPQLQTKYQSMYFPDVETLIELNKLADIMGTSASAIVNGLVSGALPQIQKQKNKRTLDLKFSMTL